MSTPFETWSPQTTARTLLRVARHGAMATLDGGSGFPYASLVSVASAPCGSPLLLLSDLARHTRNLVADDRASLLLSTDEEGDPLALPRITVSGRLERQSSDGLLARYLLRHASAADFASFGDFSLYKLAVQSGHLVAGFGRIVELPAADLLIDVAGAEDLFAAEGRIAEHMNDDHRDAVQLYATRLLGAADRDWRFVGCDPEGIEITDGARVLRLAFPQRASTAAEVRMQLVEMVKQARAAA